MVAADSFRKRIIFNLTIFWVVLAFGLLGAWTDSSMSGWETVLNGLVRFGAMGLVFSLAQPSNISALATSLVGASVWWLSACYFQIAGVDGVALSFAVAFTTTACTGLVARFDNRHQWTAPSWSPAALVVLAVGVFAIVVSADEREQHHSNCFGGNTPVVDSIEF